MLSQDRASSGLADRSFPLVRFITKDFAWRSNPTTTGATAPPSAIIIIMAEYQQQSRIREFVPGYVARSDFFPTQVIEVSEEDRIQIVSV